MRYKHHYISSKSGRVGCCKRICVNITTISMPASIFRGVNHDSWLHGPSSNTDAGTFSHIECRRPWLLENGPHADVEWVHPSLSSSNIHETCKALSSEWSWDSTVGRSSVSQRLRHWHPEYHAPAPKAVARVGMLVAVSRRKLRCRLRLHWILSCYYWCPRSPWRPLTGG